MRTVRRRRQRKRRGGGFGPAGLLPSKLEKKQKGGIVPLAAAITALIAVGKAEGLGAAGGVASYGGKKARDTLFKKVKKRKR